jgi:hypothetical protein
VGLPNLFLSALLRRRRAQRERESWGGDARARARGTMLLAAARRAAPLRALRSARSAGTAAPGKASPDKGAPGAAAPAGGAATLAEEKVVASAGVTASDVVIFVAVFAISGGFLYNEIKGESPRSPQVPRSAAPTNFCAPHALRYHRHRPSPARAQEEEEQGATGGERSDVNGSQVRALAR